jgi:hypothetical protein
MDAIVNQFAATDPRRNLVVAWFEIRQRIRQLNEQGARITVTYQTLTVSKVKDVPYRKLVWAIGVDSTQLAHYLKAQFDKSEAEKAKAVRTQDAHVAQQPVEAAF